MTKKVDYIPVGDGACYEVYYGMDTYYANLMIPESWDIRLEGKEYGTPYIQGGFRCYPVDFEVYAEEYNIDYRKFNALPELRREILMNCCKIHLENRASDYFEKDLTKCR